jgi:hypothetical protein
MIKLTLNELNDLVKECVYRIYSKLPLYEYAVHRTDFVYRVSNLLPQILESWCLIHYCSLVGRTQTKEHWKDELFAHMSNIGGLEIKSNNKFKKRLKAIYEGFEIRDLPNKGTKQISFYIERKFISKGIDVNDNVFKQVVYDCYNSLKNIAEAIAEPLNIKEYIETI